MTYYSDTLPDVGEVNPEEVDMHDNAKEYQVGQAGMAASPSPPTAPLEASISESLELLQALRNKIGNYEDVLDRMAGRQTPEQRMVPGEGGLREVASGAMQQAQDIANQIRRAIDHIDALNDRFHAQLAG